MMNFSPELRSQLLTPQLIWFSLGHYYQITYQEAINIKIDPWWIGVKVSMKHELLDMPEQCFSTVISYQKLAYAIANFFGLNASNCGIISRSGNLATVRGTQGNYHCTTGSAGYTCTCKLYRCMNNRLVKNGESPQLLKALKRTELYETHNGQPQIRCHHLLILK
ncbi:hypothetical protein IQ235_01030 [Oscillatoriales cyanobacterium LEGE 11467]|uniref:Uncharacterized protein n=1 Tax=Zarconia navalis LEGE 11467 TaxID=1828826 RepID=A0A928VS47_9CYAN|nr:hypothetical protein [Zarconia navalis]MBE9039379.1 hypothetical protein [Zarconia navalis LEGE 11467]